MVIGTGRTVCHSKISAVHKVCCKFNVCLKKLRAREARVLLKCFLVRSPQAVITLCECVMLPAQGLTLSFRVLSLEQSRIEEIVNNLIMPVVC